MRPKDKGQSRSSQRRSPLLLENQHPDWDGGESMQDTVLRMLVDKYKPLRGGTIRDCEQELKEVPPSVTVGSDSTEARAANWKNIAK